MERRGSRKFDRITTNYDFIHLLQKRDMMEIIPGGQQMYTLAVQIPNVLDTNSIVFRGNTILCV